MVVALIVLLVANANATPDPFDAQDCEDIVDFSLTYAQEALHAYDDAFDSSDPRVELADAELDARRTQLRMRAESLGCDFFLLGDMLCFRADRLVARGPYGQQLIADMRSGC